MSLDAIRKLLGALQEDPDNETAWKQLEEGAFGGELAALGPELQGLLEGARRRHADRGEAEAAARLLDVEGLAAEADPARKLVLAVERAKLLEEELIDDKGALAGLEPFRKNDPDVAELAERIARKKDKWKDLVEAFKKHALNSPDPALIAQHFVSAAVVIHQYKSKGRDKDVDTLFGEALQVDPGNLRAIQLYERVLRKRAKWPELAAHLERGAAAVADVPIKVLLLMRAARIQAGLAKDLVAAERLYREVLKVDPAQSDAGRYLIHLLSGQDRTDDLAKVYEDQLRVPGNELDLGLLVQVAMTHWRMRNDPASAAPYFSRVLALQADHALPKAFFTEYPGLASAAANEAEVEYEASGDEEIVVDDAEAPQDVAPSPAFTATSGAAEPVNDTPKPAVRQAAKPAAPSGRPGIGRVTIAIDLAQQAEEAGQADRAIEAWKGVLRLEAGNPLAREALTRLYAAAGRWNNLVEMLRQELESLGGAKSTPEGQAHRERKLEILREMVGIYQDRMNLEPMVVQTYNSILVLAVDDLEALRALGRSYEKLGRHSDVIKVLEQEAEHTADAAARIEILKRVAKIWVERFNNVNNATKPLEAILTINPGNAEAIAELKELYTKRRAWRPLFDVLRKEANTLNASARRDAIVELARLAAEKLNSASEAITLWREALDLDPTTPGALDALEKLTEREKDFAGLAEVLEKRVADGTDAEARVNVLIKLGTVYGERLNDPLRSIAAWRRVLDVKPGHPKALRVLRESYIAAGDWDALEQLYAEANDYEGLVEVLGGAADRTDDRAAKVALSFRAAGIYETQLNQPTRAFRNYERVLSVEPKNLRAAAALVPIYRTDEKWSRLVQLYEVLLEAVPAGDVETALDYHEKLRELAAVRLADRAGAFRWALGAYRLRPEDRALEAALEKAASDASAWRELVDTFDARSNQTDDTAERARLRDKVASVEADRLNAVDAAIARYQAVIGTPQVDANVIETLDRLLRRAERWKDLRDLFGVRLADTQGEERRRLLLEVADIEETRLHDPNAASRRFRAIVDDDPRDAEALAALSRLAETGGRWEELAALIAQRRDEATGAVRAELAFKLGQLRAERLHDVPSAIASYREVLGLVPHHPGALAALESMLRDEAHRVTAASLLEPEFAAIGESKKLGWVMQILLDASQDLDERRALTLRLSGVYSEQLADPRSAFELLRGMLAEQPGSGELADAIEQVAGQGGWNEELAETFSRVARRTDLDPSAQVDLARRAAAVYDDRLRRPEAGEPFHRIVIDSGALDAHAFQQLKSHYQERERWDELRTLYATWVDRSEDSGAKIELLSEEALVVEEILDQAEEAIKVYGRIHALDATHRGALRSLDRLYTRQHHWSELAALFTEWLEVTPEDARELRFRRGDVSERQLGRFDQALEDYEAVVGEDPTHAGSRQGLERLAQTRPELRARAGAVLEHLYENEGDARASDLVRMLQVRLESTTGVDDQAALQRRIAEIREHTLHDAHGAFTATVDAVLATPDDEGARAELLRLAAMAAQNPAAADALERALASERAQSSQVSILRDLASVYDDRLHDLGNAERTYRRLLAAAHDDAEVSLGAATALERVYQALQQPRGLVDALNTRARFESDPDVRRELHARAGEILENELQEPEAAITAQQARLEIDPNDRDALRALARLYERTGKWADLVSVLRSEADLTPDADQQRALRVRAAQTLEEKLADVDAAVILYADVLAAFGPDREIHSALARLYEVSDHWTELLDILDRDLQVAPSTNDRLALIVRIAELRRLKTHELSRAVEGYQEALEINSTQPTARAALDMLLSEKEPTVALGAARALSPVLESEKAWERLVTVLDRIATDTDDVDEKRHVLARAAAVCEEGLHEPRRAFGYAARELKESLSEGDLGARLDHVDRLATAAGLFAEYVETLREIAPELADPDAQIDAYMKVAELSQRPLNDLARAREYYEKALEQRPDFAAALDALERLHEGAGAYPELLDVLRRKTELTTVEADRRELLRKQAQISEGKLNDRPGAARAYESLLELGHDPGAARALEQIYAHETRWDDLTQLLENQLVQAGADEVDLHHRLGEVAARHQDSPDRALDHFREALDRRHDHAPTVTALEELGQREGYAARTAEMLEPIYRTRGDWAKVILALEARIAAENDMVVRKELLSKLGTLYEENLEDLEKALDTYARVFREDLSDRQSWEEVGRLAKLLGRFDRQAEIYASALADVNSDDDSTAELAFRAGRLFDEHVRDTRQARAMYRRTLAFDPSRSDAFAALEALLTRESAHAELLALYEEAALAAADPDEQKKFLFKIADIEEKATQDLPAAIETYRRVLEIDPVDARAIQSLDDLLQRTERWTDLGELLDRRVNDAVDSLERATLRLRLGKLRVDRLDDAASAVDAFEAIVQEKRDHREAIAALEQIADRHADLRPRIVDILEPLYRELDDWTKLVVVLNVRLQSVEDPVERGTILREIAQLKETRAGDVQGSFGAFASAFAADPGDGEARGEVERLAAEHSLWDALIAAYEAALKTTQDPIIQSDLLKAIAETNDLRRDDPRGAIEAYERLYALDESQVEALDSLQGLHVLLSDWEGLVRVLQRKVDRAMDDDTRKGLLHEIGEYERDMLGNTEAGITAFKRALDLDPSDAVSLGALDDLYSSTNHATALADVLKQRLEIEPEADERRVLALRLGNLWETELRDPARAIEAFRRAIDDAPTDREALSALDRLYQSTGAHAELIENLRTQTSLAVDDHARNTLRLRIGRLLAMELSDPGGALDVYREVLASDPANAEAITAVRKLAERETQRAEAVAVLEPIFRSAQRWDDVVAMQELKIGLLDDAFARREELRALASVHETGRRDERSAFESYRRALHEDPAHAETLTDLERLGGAQNRWSELAAVLEDESRAVHDDAVARDLAVRAAQIAEEHLHDDVRATVSYRHALSHGDEDAILASLDRIYVRSENWRDVVDVLERRVAIASDSAQLDDLEVRIARLRADQFGDPQASLAAYRNVLERTPSNAPAMAGVEQLVETPAVRTDALDVLEQTYTTLDDSAKLAWLLDLRVKSADLVSDKVRLLQDVSRLRESRLSDSAGAFAALVEAFKFDPREEQLLNEIERLAPLAGTWEPLRGVVESAVAAHRDDLDTTSVASLNLRAARWYHDHLRDNASAERCLAAAVAVEPENAEALAMLETIHRTAGRESDLVQTLRRRAEIELDVGEKKKMLREAAVLAETALHDVDLAAQTTATLLETDDSDLEALEALARLRGSQNRHAEVAELYSRRARLLDDPIAAASLRRQVAELYAGPINDLDRAIQAYRELLDFDASDVQARTAIEEILERTARYKDLEDALRSRIDAAVDAGERNETRLRLATLAETRFSSTTDAVEYLRQVIEETPTHPTAGAELERLYTQGRRWSDLSDLFERRAQDYADSGDTRGELLALVRIGELNEKELKNAARAVELYDRVLERDAENVAALSALARLHEGDQQWEKAAEMVARALALAPAGKEGGELGLRLASLRSERLKDEPGAEQALRKALDLDRESQQAIDRLKAIATKKGDFAMLAESLEHEVGVMTDTTKRVTVYRSLAEIARDKLNDPGRAATYLERANELAPDNRDLLLPLVDAYIAAGRQRDAVPVIEKIIASFGTKRSKDLATWYHRLGQSQEALGDSTAALASYDAAFKIDLTSVAILRDLGMLCYKTGDFDRAQKTFRALLLQRLDANAGISKADVYFYLGDTLRQQNDKPKAISMLERALEAEKGHARATALLAELKS